MVSPPIYLHIDTFYASPEENATHVGEGSFNRS